MASYSCWYDRRCTCVDTAVCLWSACGVPQVWEPYVVKVQTMKTAIEAACMLLRIDDIVSGLKRAQPGGGGGPQGPMTTTGDDAPNESLIGE